MSARRGAGRTAVDAGALIERGAAKMALAMPCGSSRHLAHYLALMNKWNRSQNLTAVTDPQAMVARHVLDSLAGSPWVAGGRILDVGTGAGLPGVPLAVADPAREVVLLDSRGKRVQFLLHVKQSLALDNVTVVHQRLEKYRPDGKFDTLTARAFAAVPELVRLTAPFVTAGARLVAWQGRNPSRELDNALADIPVRYAVHAVQVPGIEAPRHIAVLAGSEPPAPH